MPTDICTPGSRIDIGGIEYTIEFVPNQHQLVVRQVGSDGVRIVDRELARLIAHQPTRIPASQIDATSLSGDAWATAERYAEIVSSIPDRRPRGSKTVIAIAKASGIHPSTLYRHNRRHDPTAAVTSHARAARRDRGVSRLPEEVISIIENVVGSYYLNRQQYSIRACHELINTRLQDLESDQTKEANTEFIPAVSDQTQSNQAHDQMFSDQSQSDQSDQSEPAPSRLTSVSYASVRAFINRIPERQRVAARLGNAVAELRFGFVRGQEPATRAPLARWQIDHYHFPIQLIDPDSGDDLGAIYLTLVLDMGTRMAMGWHISLDPPSTASLALALLHATSEKSEWLHERKLDYPYPCHGLPTEIVVDNAREFKSANFARSCAEWGIKRTLRKPHAPKTGGQHVERFFRSLQMEVGTLPGSRVSKPSERGRTDRATRASMNLETFEAWFEHLILGVYHHRVHGTLKRPPIEAWKSWFEQPAAAPIRTVEDPRRFLLDLLPVQERNVTARGIRINNLEYWDDSLAPWVNVKDPTTRKKLELRVRINPGLINVVFVLLPGSTTYTSIPARDSSMLLPTSAWQLRLINQELRDAGNASVNHVLIAEARRRMEEVIASTRNRVRAERGYASASKLALEPGLTGTPGTTSFADTPYDESNDNFDFEGDA
jgi:putative transposase